MAKKPLPYPTESGWYWATTERSVKELVYLCAERGRHGLTVYIKRHGSDVQWTPANFIAFEKSAHGWEGAVPKADVATCPACGSARRDGRAFLRNGPCEDSWHTNAPRAGDEGA